MKPHDIDIFEWLRLPMGLKVDGSFYQIPYQANTQKNEWCPIKTYSFIHFKTAILGNGSKSRNSQDTYERNRIGRALEKYSIQKIALVLFIF